MLIDETRAEVFDLVDGLDVKLRRLLALIAAARDMASIVSSTDKSLEHAQELLAMADEMSPLVVGAVDVVTARLKLTVQAVVVQPRAA